MPAMDVYQTFTCSLWIQGRGVAAGQRTNDAFKNTLKWVEERCAERLDGFRKTLSYTVGYTSPAFRKDFSTDNCNGCFHPLRRCLLFQFTGSGGIVRKVQLFLSCTAEKAY